MQFSVRASLEQFTLPHPGGEGQLKISVAAPAMAPQGATIPVLFVVDGDFLFGKFGAADIMFAPVVTRIVTYQLPVARFAVPYMDAVLKHRFMQDWIAAAQEEEWVIEQFEQPAA